MSVSHANYPHNVYSCLSEGYVLCETNICGPVKAGKLSHIVFCKSFSLCMSMYVCVCVCCKKLSREILPHGVHYGISRAYILQRKVQEWKYFYEIAHFSCPRKESGRRKDTEKNVEPNAMKEKGEIFCFASLSADTPFSPYAHVYLYGHFYGTFILLTILFSSAFQWLESMIFTTRYNFSTALAVYHSGERHPWLDLKKSTFLSSFFSNMGFQKVEQTTGK